ncbi:YwiC-like family protein [Actinotalea sp. AC32]|nr:YwiC-like family protein [Actinotalea sp. AC32]
MSTRQRRAAPAASGSPAGDAPRPRRRRRGPGWVPKQHGAWAMLVAPPLVGAVTSGATWRHALLGVTWLVGYLAYDATALWLKARRRSRWWPPVRAYGVTALALGAALLVTTPSLVTWGAVYVPLLCASLALSAARKDRSLANDAVTVVAAGVVGVVAYGLGRDAEPATWLPGASSAEAWLPAGVLTAYFLGTVLYVKTMIRERGNRTVLAGSVAYHAALPVVAATAGPTLDAVVAVPVLVALLVLLAVRAVVVPLRAPGATPLQLGLGEIVATVALTTLLLVG